MPHEKGKAREETLRWTTGWWDFYSLTEHSKRQRPVEWSSSCVIFTAHPTKPIITGRHFSSSKQFHLPAPGSVMKSPSSFLPPTIISSSPDDEWLFAYYPGNGGDGIGSVWKRGSSIDAWTVQEMSTHSPNAGIVAVTWLGAMRERSLANIRLQPKGPRTPISKPTLAVVTQDFQFSLYYFRFYFPSLKRMSVSVLHPDAKDENQLTQPLDDIVDGNAFKLCVEATIGLGYNETSIFVATRGQIYPRPAPVPNSEFNPIDLTLPLDMEQSDPDQLSSDSCGEETTIQLCEIQLGFDLETNSMRLSSLPLPPIQNLDWKLTNLIFVASPHPRDLSESKDFSNSIYLVASFLEFGDYSTNPQSKLLLWRLAKQTHVPASKTGMSQWITHQTASRSYSEQIISFLAPCSPLEGDELFVGLMDTSGDSKPKVKLNQVPVGSVHALKVPDLTDSEEWESSVILVPKENVGRDISFNAAISPNDVLLCIVLSSSPAQTLVESLPKSKKPSNTNPPRSTVAVKLARAVALRRTTADLTHVLGSPTIELSEVVGILFDTYTLLETQENGVAGILLWEALGLSVEVYRSRASRSSNKSEKNNLTGRWQAAQDFCSIGALNNAFNSCKEGEGYDHNAVWQLVGLSAWTMGFVEKLLKECVLSFEFKPTSTDGDEELFGSEPSSPTQDSADTSHSPILLHLTHPTALKSLRRATGHVQRFRNHLKSLTMGSENIQMARDVLIDLVDSSGVDLLAFDKLLNTFVEELSSVNVEEVRRGLASCQPTRGLQAYLASVLRTMSTSTAIHKARLFIKPSDLVDAVARLAVDYTQKGRDLDVVSKANLTKRGILFTCLRCGGHTEIKGSSSGHASMQWFGWEKSWVKRCICGGVWIGQAA